MNKVLIRRFQKHPISLEPFEEIPSVAEAPVFGEPLPVRLKPCPFKAGRSQ